MNQKIMRVKFLRYLQRRRQQEQRQAVSSKEMPERSSDPPLPKPAVLAQKLSNPNDRDPTIGRGTPRQATTLYDARSPNINTLRPSREYRNVTLTAHMSVQEAAHQLCRLLEPHATPQAASLSLSLASLIETERLLPGFSSAVTAVVCIEISALTMDLESLLSVKAQHELLIHPDAVRIGYNQLWIQRGKLEGLIWDKGGDPFRLLSPRRVDGSLDTVSFCRGVGFPDPAFQPKTMRKSRGTAMGRSLQNADDTSS